MNELQVNLCAIVCLCEEVFLCCLYSQNTMIIQATILLTIIHEVEEQNFYCEEKLKADELVIMSHNFKQFQHCIPGDQHAFFATLVNEFTLWLLILIMLQHNFLRELFEIYAFASHIWSQFSLKILVQFQNMEKNKNKMDNEITL